MIDAELQTEIAELRLRLEEAEETIRAIQSGAVDAFVVNEAAGHRVYTLQDADRPYRLFVEEMQQGAATLAADGMVNWCNRRLAEMLKMPHAKVLGASLADLVAPADRAIYENLLWQGQRRSGRGEARLRRSDGGDVPAYLTFNVLPKDSGAAMGVLITDLTAQRHHEQLTAAHTALRQSEIRNASVVDTAIDGIITIDHHGNILEFNPAAERIFGYHREQVIGREMAELVIPPPLWERHRQGIAHYVSTGEGPILNQILELTAVRASGVEFPVEVSITRINTEDPPQFTGYIRDITERKRAEQELRDSEQRQRQLAADLSEADHRKTEFLAMLAHELRNPLAPIHNALQIVRDTAGKSEVIQSASEILERQIGQMVRLVNDLLDVSRISQGKIELRLERVELASIIRQAIETSRPAIELANHNLVVTLPPTPMLLNADPVRLAQVFGNLLNNACKYSEPKGRITLTAERQGSDVVISVRDAGIGIAPEMLPKIFELFAQADRSLERSQGGLGIGLTLVSRLIEMHGGSVSAASEGIGRGSEFIVRLPIVVDAALPPPVVAGPDHAPPPSRILIVDDNRDAAMTLAVLLKMNGHTTQTAFDGLEAVAAAEAFRPDIVLLDIGLPKLNGYEAARQIRERPWGGGMVLVALTGWGQEDDRRKSTAAGFDAHLVKPVNLDVLNSLLAQLLPKPT